MRHLKFLPDETNIDFIGWRYYAFALDGLLMLAAIVSIAIQGFNLGIDFTGGVLLEAKSAQTINIGKVRGEIDHLGFPKRSCNISVAANATNPSIPAC